MGILIYTTPACPWCKKTKEFLKSKKLKYTEKDAASNQKNQKEMFQKSGQMGVPVLDINGKIIIGYDPDAILKAVAAKSSVKKKK